MKIDAKYFMHESDRAALEALQTIPGFTQMFKAFMKIWSEKQFQIQNMSTNIRISEKQLPKYYHMLLPICEKLGIEVPELYLELDVNPNSYTAGDTKPFIVLTSGLLETLPEELIPSVLAHECGHIACHHCLYITMGSFILGEAAGMLGLEGLGMLSVQAAYAYWLRCCELSADRAAALCDGTSDKVVETCIRFAGFDKDILGQVNVEEFLNQATEYQQMMGQSRVDKTLELMLLCNIDHPLNAVRAKECRDWAATERFAAMRDYMRCEGNGDEQPLSELLRELPMNEASKFYIGKDGETVREHLRQQGFRNVQITKVAQKGFLVSPGEVVEIVINGEIGFEKYAWFPVDSDIILMVYAPQEDASARGGKRRKGLFGR